MQALVVEKWSLLAWGLAEFGLGAKKNLERNWILDFVSFLLCFLGVTGEVLATHPAELEAMP